MSSKYTKRKDGRYCTRISTGKYTEDGKPIVKMLYAKTCKELDKLAAEMRYELDHGTYAYDKGITFRKYAEKWIDVSKKATSIATKAMYNNIIKNHIEYLEDRRLKDIRKSDVQMQINIKASMPRICQQLLMTINQIMECAVDDELIVKNPCKNITLPRLVKSEKRALTDTEKYAVKHADFTDKERAFIYILYGCGLRPAELYALTRSDIDFKRCEISVNKALSFDGVTPYVSYPKTNSGIRVVQAPSFVMQAVKAYIDSNNSIILFSNDNGEYATRRAYYTIFENILKKMKLAVESNNTIHEKKIVGLSQYTFRHNYCTELYYSGISLKEAQRLMGHSDYSMIMQVYSHLDEQKENTKEKLEKLCL